MTTSNSAPSNPVLPSGASIPQIAAKLTQRARFLREALPQNEVGDCFINASSCEAIAALLDEAARIFKAGTSGEWQCRYVAPDKRCCQLSVGHDGDHALASEPRQAPAGWQQSDRIFCDGCGTVEPLVIARMEPDARNDHPATDLLCGTCRLIVATIHHAPPAPSLPEGDRPRDEHKNEVGS